MDSNWYCYVDWQQQHFRQQQVVTGFPAATSQHHHHHTQSMVFCCCLGLGFGRACIFFFDAYFGVLPLLILDAAAASAAGRTLFGQNISITFGWSSSVQVRASNGSVCLVFRLHNRHLSIKWRISPTDWQDNALSPLRLMCLWSCLPKTNFCATKRKVPNKTRKQINFRSSLIVYLEIYKVKMWLHGEQIQIIICQKRTINIYSLKSWVWQMSHAQQVEKLIRSSKLICEPI